MEASSIVKNMVGKPIPVPVDRFSLSPEMIGKRFTFSFSRGEKQILRKRKKIRVSKWAEQSRILVPESSSLPGMWRNDVTPYLTDIMDSLFHSGVQTVVVCAAPQVGKTEVLLNALGYAVDREPSPAMIIYPDMTAAKDSSRDRVLPMLKTSPKLSKYLTGSTDDEASLRINLRHMPIYMGWAHSASRLASKPIRYVFFDEIDKYPTTANKKEADPLSLAEKRGRTYRNRKFLKISTPTNESGPIWTALNIEAQVVFGYKVRCPICGHVHEMDFDQIKWPERETADPSQHAERVEAEKLAWYECPNMGCKWDDGTRDKAVSFGAWFDRVSGTPLEAYLKSKRPKKIGFHIPSWLSRFVSLSEVAAAFLRGQKSSLNPEWREKLKDFMNSHKAEAWVNYQQERSEEKILALKDDRPRLLVPGGDVVACLTAAIDTQSGRGGYFPYEIRAWGYGMVHESWLVADGEVESFEALAEVLWDREYKDAEGNQYLVRLALIDAMGHRTDEVYDFCRLNRGRILPLKGEQTMARPFSYSQIDIFPGSNKPIPGGLKLLRVNVTHYKNALSNRLAINPADPGAYHLHSEVSDAWAREMTAEYVNEKGYWECPKGRPNHAWDIAGYNLAAADLLGVKSYKQAGMKAKKKAPRKKVNPYTNGGR